MGSRQYSREDSRPVFIEEGTFKTIVASAIEVYSRETNGVLLGRNSTRNIDGVKKKVISVKNAYPIQTDSRKRSEVSHGNIAAFNRFLRAMRSLRSEMVGGYHSHPHPYESNVLSRGDTEFISEEIKEMSKMGQKHIEKGWLEILLSIKKKGYSGPVRYKWYTCSYVKKIRCRIRTRKKVGYDITISAYWVYPKGEAKAKKNSKSDKRKRNRIEYGVEEVPVYVPWIDE